MSLGDKRFKTEDNIGGNCIKWGDTVMSLGDNKIRD